MADIALGLPPQPLPQAGPLPAVERRSEAAPAASHDVVLAVESDLAAVAETWQAFEARAEGTFFQTYAWLAAWQRHVGTLRGVVPAIVSGRDRDGTLLFILPLAVERRRGIRQLAFLGSELCDYNAPLLHPAFAERTVGKGFASLWQQIIALLRADPRLAFDIVNLSKMPATVAGQPNPLLALRTVANPSGAYLTALTGPWERFYEEKRSAATRKKERQQHRRLAAFGDIRFVDDLDGAERERTLDLLFAQKAESFARMGVRNIFARPGHRELFTRFATDPAVRHLVHLSRLEVGDTIAAISIGFTDRSCYYLVLSSYDGGEIARVGPGRAHLHELLRHAIHRGYATFDFTIGDEPYKRDWSDTRLTLRDHLSAVTWRGAIAVALIQRYRATKRAIKQNEVMWRLFSRARALLARHEHRSSAPAADKAPDA